MNPALILLEKNPATLLVLFAVISINLGSALAVMLFPIYLAAISISLVTVNAENETQAE